MHDRKAGPGISFLRGTARGCMSVQGMRRPRVVSGSAVPWCRVNTHHKRELTAVKHECDVFSHAQGRYVRQPKCASSDTHKRSGIAAGEGQ